MSNESCDLSGVPKELEEMVNDYPIHLLEVRRYRELENFQTDLRYVFGFLQNEQDGKKLKEYIEENRHALEHIAEDAYDLMSVMSHSQELVMMKKDNRNKEGDYDMCKGLQEWMQDERRQGEEAGKEIGKEIGKQEGLRDSLQNLMKNMKLSLEQAMNALGIPETEREKYRASIKE